MFDVLLCTNTIDGALERSVNSCVDQTLKPAKIVLVFNGRSPGKTDLLCLERLQNKYAELDVVISPVCGLVANLNLGIACCTSALIARMDADDVAHPLRFEFQVRWMSEHPETTILGTAYRRVDENGEALEVVEPPATDTRIRRQLYWKNPLAHPTVMYRREAILALGGYRDRKNAEDYDLWVRASRHPSIGFANLTQAFLDYNGTPTEARRSPDAYKAMFKTQIQQVVERQGLVWLAAGAVSMIKLAHAAILHRSHSAKSSLS